MTLSRDEVLELSAEISRRESMTAEERFMEDRRRWLRTQPHSVRPKRPKRGETRLKIVTPSQPKPMPPGFEQFAITHMKCGSWAGTEKKQAIERRIEILQHLLTDWLSTRRSRDDVGADWMLRYESVNLYALHDRIVEANAHRLRRLGPEWCRLVRSNGRAVSGAIA